MGSKPSGNCELARQAAPFWHPCNLERGYGLRLGTRRMEDPPGVLKTCNSPLPLSKGFWKNTEPVHP